MISPLKAPFIFFSLILLLPVFATAEKSTTMAADPWCPYNCLENSDQPGYMIELAQAALEEYGIKVVYQNVNWARAKKMVLDGSIDAIVGMGKGPLSRDKYIFPKYAMGVTEICFFSRSDSNWVFNQTNSLGDMTLGWIKGYQYGLIPGFDAWIEAQDQADSNQLVTLHGENNLYPRMVKLLVDNKIDTFADDQAVVKYHLKKLGLENKVKQSGCVNASQSPVFIAFSKEIENGQIYADALDYGLERLMASGQAVEIIERYGLDQTVLNPNFQP